ncbi:MAG: hypothetical protein COA74_03725 [Gammaproteobacteria bacterium]|nr:MAG: hypothetical protein COA74_03725 [Gammaproteobacteria bacterium]
MIDKKVYKTDYESEFTAFFNTLSSKKEPVSVAMDAEKAKYSKINKMRDTESKVSTRNKLWKNF